MKHSEKYLYFLIILVFFLGEARAETLVEKQAREKVLMQTQIRREKNIAFFEEMVAKIDIRTAWNPKKWELMGTTFEKELEKYKLKEEFANASSNIEYLRAIHKLNHLRYDHHLKLSATYDYISEKRISQAPIRLYTDMSDEKNPFIYVANFTQAVEDKGVKLGDKLLAVNEIPINEYIDLLKPYLQFSTLRNMYVEKLSHALVAKSEIFGPEIPQKSTVKLSLEPKTGGQTYDVELSYSGRYRNINWKYPYVVELYRQNYSEDKSYLQSMYKDLGFEEVYDNNVDCALYINKTKKLNLIEWYDFERVSSNARALVNAAQREGTLDWDVIIDATRSSGGGGGPHIVKYLVSQPFKVTFGNVRTTDKEWVRKKAQSMSSKVRNWIMDAVNAGKDYTTNEPFKLVDFPAGSDGIMKPASTRFNGKKVALIFTLGGSQYDQFCAMLVDNNDPDIHVMGMPAGGYSNTWEWGENITLPNGKGIAWEYDIGHTVRKNGEALEGNPAIPHTVVPITRDNYQTYYKDLIIKAEQYLNGTHNNSHSMFTNTYSSIAGIILGNPQVKGKSVIFPYKLENTFTHGALHIYNSQGKLIKEIKIGKENYKNNIGRINWNGFDSLNNQITSGCYIFKVIGNNVISISQKLVIP